MGIELERLKKERFKKTVIFYYFLLIQINFYWTYRTSRQFITKLSHKNLASSTAEKINIPFYFLFENFKNALISSVFLFKKKNILSKKLLFTKIKNASFVVCRVLIKLFRVFVTFSLSLSKLKYSHSEKNVFAYFSEKSNLLERLDNNKGLSFLKVLQITII